MESRFEYFVSVVVGAVLVLSPLAVAQDREAERDKERKLAEQYDWSPSWEYTLAPYFWISRVEGSATVGGEEFPVDLGGAEDLNPVFSFHFEAQRKKLAGWLAITITDLEQGLTSESGERGKFRLRILRPELAAAYRLLASRAIVFEGYAGFRYNDWRPRFERSMRMPGEPTAIEINKGWFDPIIGARFRTRVGERVPIFIRGDVGGFGVGAEISWAAQVGVTYLFSQRFGLAGAYRYFYADYESGSAGGDFAYDADQHGPLIGVVLLF